MIQFLLPDMRKRGGPFEKAHTEGAENCYLWWLRYWRAERNGNFELDAFGISLALRKLAFIPNGLLRVIEYAWAPLDKVLKIWARILIVACRGWEVWRHAEIEYASSLGLIRWWLITIMLPRLRSAKTNRDSLCLVVTVYTNTLTI